MGVRLRDCGMIAKGRTRARIGRANVLTILEMHDRPGGKVRLNSAV